MKRIVFGMGLVLGAAGVACANYPADAERLAKQAQAQAERLAADLAGNPLPVGLAVGTFLATVGYHKAKGKSLRESLTVAATRVTVVPVPVPVPAPTEEESAVVKRAKARTTRAQLVGDQIGLENRLRAMPAEVAKAEKDVCYAETALADAEKTMASRQALHDDASERLDALRHERAASKAELAAIADELKKINLLV